MKAQDLLVSYWWTALIEWVNDAVGHLPSDGDWILDEDYLKQATFDITWTCGWENLFVSHQMEN